MTTPLCLSRDYFVASLILLPASLAASPVLSAAFFMPSLVLSAALSIFSPIVSFLLQPCPMTSAATSIGQTIHCFIIVPLFVV